MKEIAKALLEAQKEMGNATKDSSNPFFKSKYADLNSIREACMPSLNKYGIVVLQPTVFIDGKNFIQTILLHESGQQIDCLTEIIYSKQNDAQSQGSGITYARRYGLQSLINVGAEDDDGNKASAKVEKTEKQIDDKQSKEIAELLETCNLPTVDAAKIKKNVSSMSYEKAVSCIKYLKGVQYESA
jgi:Tfp pilus assembly protein PilZ